jgi:hypothetical protein
MTQRDMFGAAVWVGAPDRNYTDTAVLHTTASRGACVEVYFAEERLPDGRPDMTYNHF